MASFEREGGFYLFRRDKWPGVSAGGGENKNIEDGVAYRCSPDRPNEQKPLAEYFSNLLGCPLDRNKAGRVV